LRVGLGLLILNMVLTTVSLAAVQQSINAADEVACNGDHPLEAQGHLCSPITNKGTSITAGELLYQVAGGTVTLYTNVFGADDYGHWEQKLCVDDDSDPWNSGDSCLGGTAQIHINLLQGDHLKGADENPVEPDNGKYEVMIEGLSETVASVDGESLALYDVYIDEYDFFSFHFNQGSTSLEAFFMRPVAAPSIEVKKSVSINGQVSWEDADDPPGPPVMEGSDLYFKFVVTNTGDVALTDLALSDSQFADEIATLCTVPLSLAPHGAVGDRFGCVIGPLTSISGHHTNTATAQGRYGGAIYDDTDRANYFGLTANPAIVIEKSTNGEDGDSGTGPLIPVGDPVFWTYVVTNTGNVDLTEVTVTDNKLGTICYIGDLGAGLSETCLATATAEPKQYENLGSAAGAFLGTPVSDEDYGHYYGVPWYIPSPTPVTPTPTNTPAPPTMSADAGARCARWWVDLFSTVTAEYYVRVKLDGVTQVEDTGIFTDSKSLGYDWDLWGTGERTMRITYWAKAGGRQVGDDKLWIRDCGTAVGPTPTPVTPTPTPMPPTPTPTPLVEVLAVESLPVTGVAVHPGVLGGWWLTAIGLLLIGAGGILRGLADRK